MIRTRSPRALVLTLVAVVGAALLAAPRPAAAATCGDPSNQACAVIDVHVTTDLPGYIGIDVAAFFADNPDGPASSALVSGNLPDGQLVVAPGTFKLVVDGTSWYGGKSFRTAKVITVKPGRTKINLDVPISGTVYQAATNRNGVHVPFVRMVFYDSVDPTEALGRATGGPTGTISASAGPARRALLIDPTGRYKSRWMSPRSSFASYGPTSNPSPSLDLERILPLPTPAPAGRSGGDLRGIISTSDGDYGRPGVFAFPADDDTNWVDWSSLYSIDTDGDEIGDNDHNEFVIRDLSAGRYKLRFGDGTWVGGTSHADATVFTLGETDVQADFTVPPHGDVAGRVRSTRGAVFGLGGLLVTAYEPGSAKPLAYAGTDETGRFELSALPEKPIEIRITDAENLFVQKWVGGTSSRTTADPVTPKASQRVDLGDIVVSDGLVALSAPVITGARAKGRTLTGQSGEWSRPGSYTRRWYRDGKPITGATGKTYVVRSADRGHRLTFGMTNSKAGYVTAKSLSRSTSTIG